MDVGLRVFPQFSAGDTPKVAQLAETLSFRFCRHPLYPFDLWPRATYMLSELSLIP